ncbi:hypothetical protein CR513_61444, partial [Mucuna pruriens]
MQKEVRRQLEVVKATTGRIEQTPSPYFGDNPLARKLIEPLSPPPYFKKLLVDPFDSMQDPHTYLQAFQKRAHVMVLQPTLQNHPFFQQPSNTLCIIVRGQQSQAVGGDRPFRH